MLERTVTELRQEVVGATPMGSEKNVHFLTSTYYSLELVTLSMYRFICHKMSRFTILPFAILISLGMVLVACSDDSAPTEPDPGEDEVSVDVLGEVVADYNDEGVEGASVAIYDTDNGTPFDEATTDADGSYSLSFTVDEGEEPSHFEVEAEAEGFEAETETMSFTQSATVDLTMEALEMDVVVSGEVLEQLTADPFSGAEVAAYRDGADDPLASTTSETAGTYELSFAVLEPEEPEELKIEAEGNDYTYHTELDFAADLGHEIALGPFAGGFGTDAEPYEIETAEQLQAVEEDLAGAFVQTDDIDASEMANWNDDAGFDPIGYWDDESNDLDDPAHEPFTGAFDGNGHVITDLNIDRPSTEGVGLFAFVSEDGWIEEITLESASITGEEVAGALAGVAAGTSEFHNLASGGSVEGTGGAAGGLIAAALGGAEIHTSHSTANVQAEEGVAGGLAYVIGDNATVHTSFATGEVEAGGDVVGGLLGGIVDDAEVRDSYATSRVIGFGDQVGGLVGLNQGLVRDSYSTGRPTGDEDVGGLIGENHGDIIDAYWDEDASEETTGVGTGDDSGATGLTTSEMTGDAASDNLDGFNFSDTWQVVSGDYPALWWEDL